MQVDTIELSLQITGKLSVGYTAFIAGWVFGFVKFNNWIILTIQNSLSCKMILFIYVE